MTPFIPRWLDERGLSLTAFRVLCHLWRRAKSDGPPPWTCYPSVTSIGKACGIKKRDTVHAALRELKSAGLLARDRRDGTSSLCSLVVPSGGISRETGQPPKEDNGCPAERDNGCPPIRDKGCPAKRDTKVPQLRSPTEGSPSEGEREPPPPASVSLSDSEWIEDLKRRHPSVDIDAELDNANTHCRRKQKTLSREYFEQVWIPRIGTPVKDLPDSWETAERKWAPERSGTKMRNLPPEPPLRYV